MLGALYIFHKDKIVAWLFSNKARALFFGFIWIFSKNKIGDHFSMTTNKKSVPI